MIEYSTDLTVNMIDEVETYSDCEEHLVKILDLVAKNQNSLKLRLAIDYSKQNVKSLISILDDRKIVVEQLMLTS